VVSQAVEAVSAVAVPQVDGKFDVIFLLPYAFSDHPSFPEGILKRYLEFNGFSVGVIETPFWQKKEDFGLLGRPKLFFAIIPGPVDSVVLNYTSSRKRRNEDLYQMDNEAFFKGFPPSIKYKKRPDLVTVVFANRLKEIYKDVPIIIGGIEASQRTFSHYDFIKQRIKRSILLDSRADILVNGMGEKQLVQIAEKLKIGEDIFEININGTSKIIKNISEYKNAVILPSHSEVIESSEQLLILEEKVSKALKSDRYAIQKVDNRYIVRNPLEKYNGNDLDIIYNLGYKRTHLFNKGYSDALNMNLFSITSHRGCGGGCSFCSISSHEGKRVVSRSVNSILKEVEQFKGHKRWKGVIGDLGGASAESFGTDCIVKFCGKNSCLFPNKCLQLAGTEKYRKLLKTVREYDGVRKLFIGSGLRYDVLLENPSLLEDIMVHHTGKFLRVAPEHTEDSVLLLMRKPSWERFLEFYSLFKSINKNLKRKIDLYPYLIVGFPGEREQDLYNMKKKLKALRLKTTDAQIFTPTPGIMATAYYYSELSSDKKEIFVEKDIKKLLRRKAILSGKVLS